MFFEKINSKNYIVQAQATALVENIINKINKKRNRLLEKGQITENEFEPLTVNYKPINKDNIEDVSDYMDDWFKQKLLQKNRKDYVIAEFSDMIINVKSWEILGVITPIEGSKSEYTLQSFSEKDMPEKYRHLEDPSNCEHCNTSRKRNDTFVIRNKDTQEMLQVGSSCMSDFISKDDLSLLMMYAKAINKIDQDLKNPTKTITRTLFDKNEVLATMISLEESEMNFGIDNIKRVYDPNTAPEDMIEKFKSLEPTEDHRDKADEILDFYEDLKINDYGDRVFNVANLLNSNSDFFYENEIQKIIEVLRIKEAIETKNNFYKELKSDFNFGVEVGESEAISYDYKDLFYVAKMATEEFGFKSPKEDYYLNTATYMMNIINPDRLSLIKEEYQDKNPDSYENEVIRQERKIFDVENIQERLNKLHQQWKKDKEDGEVKLYYKELLDFAEIRVLNENDFEASIKDVIKNADKLCEKEGIKLNRRIIWAERLLESFKEEIGNKNRKAKTNELGITGNIFEKEGDSFEKYEMQFKSVEERSSELYGTSWNEYVFEDEFGNKLVWSTNNKDLTDEPYSKEWAEQHKDKWIEIKGKFKNYGKLYKDGKKEDVIKINYVSAVSDFKDKPTTNGEIVMLEKGKKFKVADYMVESNESLNYGSKVFKKLRLVDSEGEVKELISQDTNLTHLEENKFYRIGHMGDKKIRNFNATYADEIEGFENETVYLTKAKLNKEFGVKQTRKAKP